MRIDHSAPLSHTAKMTLPTAACKFHRGFLRNSIRSHYSFFRFKMTFPAKTRSKFSYFILNRFNRKWLTNDTGRSNQHLLRRYSRGISRKFTHLLRFLDPICVTRISILTIHNNRTRYSTHFRKMLFRHSNRCALHFIRCIYTCRYAILLTYDKTKIIFLRRINKSTVNPVRLKPICSTYPAANKFIPFRFNKTAHPDSHNASSSADSLSDYFVIMQVIKVILMRLQVAHNILA